MYQEKGAAIKTEYKNNMIKNGINSNQFGHIKSVANEAIKPKTKTVGIKFEKYLFVQNFFLGKKGIR